MSETNDPDKLGRPYGQKFIQALAYLRAGYTVRHIIALGIPRRTAYRAKKYLEWHGKGGPETG